MPLLFQNLDAKHVLLFLMAAILKNNYKMAAVLKNKK